MSSQLLTVSDRSYLVVILLRSEFGFGVTTMDIGLRDYRQINVAQRSTFNVQQFDGSVRPAPNTRIT